MATMKATRTLREAPNGTPMDVMAPGGAKVDILANQDVPGAGSWTKVKLVAASGAPEGWVSSDAVDAAGVLPAGPIDKALFAKECWRQALYTGTNAHYLAAVAELRSHIRTGSSGGKSAPFNITQAEWDGLRQDPEFQFDFESGDIDNWRLQCAVFAVMTLRKLKGLITPPDNKRPSAIELYIAQLGAPPADDAARAALVQQLKEALDATRSVVLAAGADILADPQTAVTPTNASSANINLGKVPAGREEIAKLIISKFRDAGYGPIQQIAALANAIGESNLKPNAHAAVGEDSFGLFQLNRNGGLGTGFTREQLIDPSTNIDIILKEVKKHDAFKNATSLFDAVDIFVRKVERPANPGRQVDIRTAIAKSLQNSQTLLA